MKPIPGYPDYYISQNGTVWSEKKWRGTNGRVVREWRNRGGYSIVDLKVGSKKKHRPVHSLVLLTWVGPAPEGHEADHINRVRNDNRLSNLRYVTRSMNNNNSVRSSRYSKFKGVYFQKDKPRTKPWFAQLKVSGKYFRSKGYFERPEEAALEYDQLAIKHYGSDKAMTNFGDQSREYIHWKVLNSIP